MCLLYAPVINHESPCSQGIEYPIPRGRLLMAVRLTAE